MNFLPLGVTVTLKGAMNGSLTQGFVWLLTAEDALDFIRRVGESVSSVFSCEAAKVGFIKSVFR